MLARRTLPLAAVTSAVAVGACLVPSLASAQSVTHVRCQGSAAACTASVSLAGGASNERVAIQLPGSRLRLVSAQPSSPTLDGAYSISDQASRAGGREYVFTLNAAEAPAGSTLTFRFRRPGSGKPPSILRCTGSATLCRAKVPIGGGASNRKVVVQLPGTDLGLVIVKPSSPSLQGAYSLTRQRLRQGNSEFTFVLNADQATPAGSRLTLTFASQ